MPNPLPDRVSRHDDQRADERRAIQTLSSERRRQRDQEPVRPRSLAQHEGFPRLAMPGAVSTLKGGLAQEVCRGGWGGGGRRVLSTGQRIRLGVVLFIPVSHLQSLFLSHHHQLSIIHSPSFII